jgi:predicted flap endonuclease-1-like 5' DNA nuclease
MHKKDARGVEVPVKRGIAVWIFGFLTLLAALSSFGVIVYWARYGSSSIFEPYLIGEIISSLVGDLTVENYLWISLTTTFIFLGITCIIAYRKLPPDPEIIKMFVKVGGNLAALKKTHETTATELVESIEHNRKTNLESFNKANTNLEDTKKETLDVLEKQGKTMQKVRRDMVSTVETKVGETREEMLGALKKQETEIRQVGRLGKQGAAAIKKQKVELEDMKIRLEKIEEKLVPPQPRLKSQDNPEEIRGIGPRLGEELGVLGITNVGELITADPAIIDEKTRVSRDMAERLQATAQLLMIPGVDENDAELLVDAGITSRRELADQDLVPLGRKISEIVKTYIEEGKMSEDEKPTIEEISSWIRIAR